jgi:hypothetical protein
MRHRGFARQPPSDSLGGWLAMSEQEFELYLKLLSRCLSLTPGQRGQIADELRDHLEERLDELARAGVPREKAIVQALDEFGDAAVLAAHFATIARLKRRRFLMRLSLGSVGALTAGLLMAFAFWPENRAVRGPVQNVVAAPPQASRPDQPKSAVAPILAPGQAGAPARTQSEKDRIKALEEERDNLKLKVAYLERGTHSLEALVKRTREFHGRQNLQQQIKGLEHELRKMTLESKSRGKAAEPGRLTEIPIVDDLQVYTLIDEALDERSEFTIEPQALLDALDFIATRYRIPLTIDRKTMEEAGIDPVTEVAMKIPGMKLRNVLKMLLSPKSLDFEIRDGALVITTHDEVESRDFVVIYDCRDLIHTQPLKRAQPNAATAPAAKSNADTAAKLAADISKSQTPNKNSEPPRASDSPLITVLKAATSPELWETTEHPQREITEFDGMVIVRHNRRAQDEVRLALSTLRRLRAEGAFAGVDGTTRLASPAHRDGTPIGEAAKPRAYDPATPARKGL